MIRIAHASIDENGKVSGGAAGDNNGKEVCIRSWYNKEWDYVIRFKDVKQAARFADALEAAAANNNIGYAQDNRNSLLKEAEAVNWDISKIKNKCECDCSSLICVAAIVAGVPKAALYVNGNCATTRNIRARLNNTGLVQVTSDKKYTKSDKLTLRGDMYLKEGSHIVAAIDSAIVEESKEEYKEGDIIKLIPGATYANGKSIPAWVFKSTLYYRGKNDKGIVFSVLKTGAVTGTVKPEMIAGNNPTSSHTPTAAALKVGDRVKVKQGATTYNGGKLASFVYNREHQVKQIDKDRVVITYKGTVVCAIHKDSLTRV